MNNKFKKSAIFFALGIVLLVGLYQIQNPISTTFTLVAWGLIISFLISVIFAIISLFKDLVLGKMGSVIIIVLIICVMYYFYSRSMSIDSVLQGI